MSGLQLIKIAKITSPHGIKGEVKLFLYAENLSQQTYPRFYLEEKEIEISFRGFKGKTAIGKIPNIESRNQAEELKNQDIYINRADLPKIKDPDAFYIDDLIGCCIINDKEKSSGEIIDVQNHGAGDIIVIEFNNGKTELYPFIEAIFPKIDLKKKQVSFVNPEIL